MPNTARHHSPRDPEAWTLFADVGDGPREAAFETRKELAEHIARACAWGDLERWGDLSAWNLAADFSLLRRISRPEEFLGADGAPRWIHVARILRIKALSPNGKPVDCEELRAEGARLMNLRRSRRYYRRVLDDWNGEGPVPGTGRRTRYSRRYYRRVRTMAERRSAAVTQRQLQGDELLFLSSGELAALEPRGRRGLAYIPSSWDDIHRRHERAWKSQGVRAGQWDKSKLGVRPDKRDPLRFVD